MQHISHTEDDTAALAAEIANNARPGDIICLSGDLGTGKTVFARAFIRALAGTDTEVPSPTFTLLQTYETRNGPLRHFDLYRIQDSEEIFELGWEEDLNGTITLVEWPQRLGPCLPPRRTDIVFKPGATPESRIITVTHHDG